MSKGWDLMGDGVDVKQVIGDEVLQRAVHNARLDHPGSHYLGSALPEITSLSGIMNLGALVAKNWHCTPLGTAVRCKKLPLPLAYHK